MNKKNLEKTGWVIIRLIVLPAAFIIHLLPNIVALCVNLYRFVLHGGEFIVYNSKTRESISDIFKELERQRK